MFCDTRSSLAVIIASVHERGVLSQLRQPGMRRVWGLSPSFAICFRPVFRVFIEGLLLQ
jgi:hypothetical protein